MGRALTGEEQANQSNISKIEVTNNAAGSVAVFNDVIRDGLKGSVFDRSGCAYINGCAEANAGKIKFGISGGSTGDHGWTVKNAMVINYASAHDNRTLWDKLAVSAPDSTKEERLAMNRLAAAIIMISRGTPFMQAGEEMLRTKRGDENSYKSGDEINSLNWDTLTPDSDEYKMMLYYKGLIEMRKKHSVFTDIVNTSVSFDELPFGALAVKFEATDGKKAAALINPTNEHINYELDGEYKLIANGENAGAAPIATHSGEIIVDAKSVYVYVE